MPALSDSKSNEILKIENISPNFQPVKQEVSVVVAGSIAVDLSCDYKPFDASSEISPVPHTSNPAVISQSIGGVGNNVATAAHLVSPSSSVRLCSLIADDLAGNLILSNLQRRGQDTAGIKILPSDHTNRTAQYVAVNNANKDLHIAMADMQIIAQPQPDFSRTWKPLLEAAKPKWLVIDSNWHESAIRQWLGAAKSAGAKVAYEPVSAAKSQRLFYPLSSTMGKDARAPLGVFPSHNVDLATPNQHELAAMHSAAAKNLYLERQDWWTAIDSLGISSAGARDRFIALTNKKLVEEGIPQRSIQILPFIPTIITKLGAQGLLVTRLLGADHPDLREPDIAKYILSRCNNGNAEIGGVYMRLYPASEVMKQGEIVSVNGVGDTFLGVLVAGLARGARLDEELIGIAQRAAVLTLKSGESVSPRLRELKGELEGLVE
jgi:pseudouridine-5'-phosphate glycosidase/pseudouridine kinase